MVHEGGTCGPMPMVFLNCMEVNNIAVLVTDLTPMIVVMYPLLLVKIFTVKVDILVAHLHIGWLGRILFGMDITVLLLATNAVNVMAGSIVMCLHPLVVEDLCCSRYFRIIIDHYEFWDIE